MLGSCNTSFLSNEFFAPYMLMWQLYHVPSLIYLLLRSCRFCNQLSSARLSLGPQWTWIISSILPLRTSNNLSLPSLCDPCWFLYYLFSNINSWLFTFYALQLQNPAHLKTLFFYLISHFSHPLSQMLSNSNTQFW